MKLYTIADIRALGPCYDPARYIPEDWTGTILDILDGTQCPAKDRLWVVSHWLPDRTLRLFAVWCARQALALLANPAARSLAVCDVAERFANGTATGEELAAAREAARAAAREAARAAAREAARAAARAAAGDAARAAAREAARAAAGDAARAAAREAAWAAREAAWAAAREAAGDAAREAAWAAQLAHLRAMIA